MSLAFVAGSSGSTGNYLATGYSSTIQSATMYLASYYTPARDATRSPRPHGPLKMPERGRKRCGLVWQGLVLEYTRSFTGCTRQSRPESPPLMLWEKTNPLLLLGRPLKSLLRPHATVCPTSCTLLPMEWSRCIPSHEPNCREYWGTVSFKPIRFTSAYLQIRRMTQSEIDFITPYISVSDSGKLPQGLPKRTDI